MLLAALLLIFGFIILVKGADLLVDGAVLIAERLRISAVIIGLTIVAFGTSTPELAVNVVSALHPENSDIGLGNIVGSNIANIGLIVGLAALIIPLTVQRIIITREIPFMLLSALIFLVLVSDVFLGGLEANFLSAADGLVLLMFFAVFIYYLINAILNQREEGLVAEFGREFKSQEKPKLGKSILLTILGLAGVVWGGQLVVDNAATLARAYGLSEILIGLTIVAIGTSLPELATSVVAAYKKEPDIAVGNIVGSNIFNTLFILGINAVISPIPFETSWFFDAWVMILFSVLLFATSVTGRQIKRWEGLMIILTYFIYLGFIIHRG